MRNEKNNDDIKNTLSSPEIPQQLEPEQIKEMLDEKGSQAKRSNIKHKNIIRAVAGIAACAVICTVAVQTMGQKESIKVDNISSSENSIALETSGSEENIERLSYMSGAADYSAIYNCFAKPESENNAGSSFLEGIWEHIVGSNDKNTVYDGSSSELASDNAENRGDIVYEEGVETDNETGAEQNATASGSDTDSSHEYSDTFNQEEDVYEADIVKTDGENIYYSYNSSVKVASVNKGSFIGSYVLNPADDIEIENSDLLEITDMYLIDDKLIIVSNYNDFYSYQYSSEYGNSGSSKTYISVYSAGAVPEFLGDYCQDGDYSDIRMVDGFIYLISNSSSQPYNDIEDENDIESYIPKYSVCSDEKYVEPDDILLPEGEISERYQLSYTVIGGLSLNGDTPIESVDVKVLADYTGNSYCSKDNLYVTAGWENTSITRLALSEGTVTPSATGNVEGYIKDQFSMSEYNGMFRIAVSYEQWEEEIYEYEGESVASRYSTGRNNNLYVLDMDMNVVGSITDFGINETIKSVNFNGDIAYVVTYEQTDPLYAIDLSDAANPVILDDYKINGYSTYMQRWNDNLLLGFGIDADENGVEQGVKLVMFDTSDPNELKEVGFVAKSFDGLVDEEYYEYGGYVWSEAAYERKALYIDPQRNIIGFPLNQYSFSYGENYQYFEENSNKYVFYSYNDGQFTPLGEIEYTEEQTYPGFNRAIYIDGVIYALGSELVVSANSATLQTIDSLVW